jgi:hypothetical protein
VFLAEPRGARRWPLFQVGLSWHRRPAARTNNTSHHGTSFPRKANCPYGSSISAGNSIQPGTPPVKRARSELSNCQVFGSRDSRKRRNTRKRPHAFRAFRAVSRVSWSKRSPIRVNEPMTQVVPGDLPGGYRHLARRRLQGESMASIPLSSEQAFGHPSAASAQNSEPHPAPFGYLQISIDSAIIRLL